jgi:hypothetical protein
VAVTSADQRSGAIARLLASGRHSPERAIVEQSRCDALSREPEAVNPRVCADERWCLRSPSRTPTGSDLMMAGLGKPRGAAFFARVWDQGFFSFSYLIRVFSTLIQTISYLFLR